MKFTIDKPVFIKVLQRVQGIVEKRNTMPILANVLLEASKGRINVMATDLEVFIKDSAQANITEDGSLTVNARKIFEIVKELPGETIDVTSGKEDKITLKAGKARFSVMGLPSKDFPAFPAIDEAKLEAIQSADLKEMIDKTVFAVSTDETRYNINGFLLEKEDSTIRMVATDGHRLALIEKTDSMAVENKSSVLLPRKGVLEIRKVLDEKEGDFFLAVLPKSAVMKKDTTVISIRLLEGEFPDYKKVIPRDNTNEAVADRITLLGALKRVSILSTDKIKGVKFSFSANKLTLSTSSPDLGDATEDIEIKYNNEDVEIAFNARYLMDMLESLTDEGVTITLKDALSPGIVRPLGVKDYTYIIMPMRL